MEFQKSHSVVLHRKTSVKYLGVLLVESLNLTSHAKSLKSKLSFASSMIYKIRNFVPIIALRIIYYCSYIVIFNIASYPMEELAILCFNLLILSIIMFCALSHLVILNVT